MIRDKLVLYKNYYDLNIRCYSCNYFNHIALNCPMVHVTFNLEKVIKSKSQTDGVREIKFQRKIAKKTKSLLLMKKSIEAVRKMFASTSFLFSNNPSYNTNSCDFDKANGFSSNNVDSFPFSNEDGYIDDIHSLPSLDFVESEDVCSIEKKSADNFIKKDTSERMLRSEIKLSSSMLKSSSKKDKISSFSLNYSLYDNPLMIFVSYDFNFSFDKMKNFEVYFIHNNAESIIKNIPKPDILNETNIMNNLKKKKEGFNEKFISSENLEFKNIFTAPKIKLDQITQMKIKTHELLNNASPNILLNKKLRQAVHKKFYDQTMQDEKLAIMSKKILKTRKWLCFECRKKVKISSEKQYKIN